jgi:hypothetical protein
LAKVRTQGSGIATVTARGGDLVRSSMLDLHQRGANILFTPRSIENRLGLTPPAKKLAALFILRSRKYGR